MTAISATRSSTPLRLPSGAVLLVDRGYVPSDRKLPASRAAGEPQGDVTVTGLLRLAPAAKPIGSCPTTAPSETTGSGSTFPPWPAAAELGPRLPFYVDADAAPNPGGLPQSAARRGLDLPNNHLQYAITWYALAAALAVIYHHLACAARAAGEPHASHHSLPAPSSPLPPPRRAAGGRGDAAMGQRHPDARGRRRRARRAARHAPRGLPRDPDRRRMPRSPRRRRGAERARSLAARQSRRDAPRWLHATAVPADLVEALSKACSASEMALAQGAAGRRFRRRPAGAAARARRWCARSPRRRRRASARALTRRCSTNTSPAAVPPPSTRCSTISPRSCRA